MNEYLQWTPKSVDAGQAPKALPGTEGQGVRFDLRSDEQKREDAEKAKKEAEKKASNA